MNNFINDSRVLKIGKSLNKNGFELIVVALLKGDVPENEMVEGFSVHRIKLRTMNLPKGKVFGLLKYMEFFLRVIIKYRKYDIWHCNDFEPFLIGIIAKFFRRKLKLVYDCHEFESEKNGQRNLERKFVKWIEKQFVKKAARVITVSEGIAHEYEQRYGLQKVDLILNAPHKALADKTTLFRDSFNISDTHTIFIYQGVLSKGRGVELLLQAFAELQNKQVSIVFMGNGVLKNKILDYVKQCTNIYYQAAVPYSEVLSHTSSADVGIISVENTCLSYYYCMPNKLFEYMQGGLAVITTPLYDVQKIVLENEMGWVMPDFSVEEFKKTIQIAAQSDRTQLMKNAKEMAQNYCWENEEKKLLEIYQSF